LTAAWALEDALVKLPSVKLGNPEVEGVLPRTVVSM
jgi:hypothetical protein